MSLPLIFWVFIAQLESLLSGSTPQVTIVDEPIDVPLTGLSGWFSQSTYNNTGCKGTPTGVKSYPLNVCVVLGKASSVVYSAINSTAGGVYTFTSQYCTGVATFTVLTYTQSICIPGIISGTIYKYNSGAGNLGFPSNGFYTGLVWLSTPLSNNSPSTDVFFAETSMVQAIVLEIIFWNGHRSQFLIACKTPFQVFLCPHLAANSTSTLGPKLSPRMQVRVEFVSFVPTSLLTLFTDPGITTKTYYNNSNCGADTGYLTLTIVQNANCQLLYNTPDHAYSV